MSRAATHGFTLIEVLVAVSVLAVLATLGYRGLDQVHLGADRLSQTADSWQALSAVFERMGRDVRQALPQALSPGDDERFWQLKPPDMVNVSGYRGELTFFRSSPVSGQAQRVTYEWGRDSADVAGSTALWLLLWSTGEPFDIGLEARESRRLPLLDRLQGVEVACLDRTGNWHRRWSAEGNLRGGDDLPRAVRFELVLADGRRIERIFDLPAAN